MGSKRGARYAGALSRLEQATGTLQAERAQQSQEQAEDVLGYTERFLGTQEQVAGYGTDMRALEFQGRYQYDPQFEADISSAVNFSPGEEWFNAWLGGEMQKRFATGNTIKTAWGQEIPELSVSPVWGGRWTEHDLPTLLQDLQREANSYLDEAQMAAEAGQYDRAEELRRKAEDTVNSVQLPSGISAEGLWTTTGGPSAEDIAKAKLSSPIAQATGELVRTARAFADPTSTESQRFKESLTAGAREVLDVGRERELRSLATARRDAEREARDMARGRGGARNIAAETAVLMRQGERFGTAAADVESRRTQALAQITGEAARFFEGFRLDFMQNTSQFAQAFLQNQAGVRDAYQNRILELTQTAMGFADSAAARMASVSMDVYKMSQQSGGWGSVLGQIGGRLIGATVGGLGAGVGGAVGEGLGGMLFSEE